MNRAILILCLISLNFLSNAQEVDTKYKIHFFKYDPEYSLKESLLNSINMSSRDVGYSVALIAGVWKYPNAESIGFDKMLNPAKKDINNLKRYLRDFEYFNEIIVIENDDVNIETLTYYLQEYIPERVNKPNSRFLFAYTGHGIQRTSKDGYILLSKASSFKERRHIIKMSILKALIDEVIPKAFHSLVLINSCYSGSFISKSFGNPNPLIPKDPGAHVITAGSANQQAWSHRGEEGGSDFFDIILSGLDRRADKYPSFTNEYNQYIIGDGIITSDEIYSFLRTEFRRLNLDKKQMPQSADLNRFQSLGSFYFLRKGIKVKDGAYIGAVNQGISFGNNSVSKDEIDALMNQAKQLRVNGELTKAVQLFNKIISKDKNNKYAFLNRGASFYDKEDFNSAIADYSKAIKIDPEYSKAFINRGLSHQNIGSSEKAIADYTKAIEIDPQNAIAYNKRGLTYDNLKNYEKAIADYTKAIEIDPHYAFAYFNRGLTYNKLKNYEKAIADYTKAIEIDPHDAIAYYNRGLSYDNLKNYEKAIADYTKAIEIDPHDAIAYNNRAISYYNLKNFEKAIADSTKAIEIDPQYANAYINRGFFYDNLKNFEKAIADYTKAIEIDSQDAFVYYNRGIAYRKLGKLDLARKDELKYRSLKK